jgi:hypothetical protein
MDSPEHMEEAIRPNTSVVSQQQLYNERPS